jgi:NAD+ synthase
MTQRRTLAAAPQGQSSEIATRAGPFRADVEAIEAECLSFLEATVTEAGVDGLVVGLDGGLGSSTAAALAVEALGSESVYGLALTADGDPRLRDAQEVAFELGIDFRTVDPEPAVDGLVDSLDGSLWNDPEGGLSPGVPVSLLFEQRPEERDGFDDAVDAAAERARRMAVSFEARLRDRLVLGGADRTERSLGRRDGGDADLLPLGERYRTEVRRLARHLGLPDGVVESGSLPGPAAEAAPPETSVATVDAVLRRLEEGCTVERTATELDVESALVAACAEAYRENERGRAGPSTPGTCFC